MLGEAVVDVAPTDRRRSRASWFTRRTSPFPRAIDCLPRLILSRRRPLKVGVSRCADGDQGRLCCAHRSLARCQACAACGECSAEQPTAGGYKRRATLRGCGSARSGCRSEIARTYYTDGQKALMWERWRAGWTLHQIAQLFARKHGSVRGILAETGGIRPPERSRSKRALTLSERQEISRAVAAGQSFRSISARLCRAASTISREVGRNGGQEASR